MVDAFSEVKGHAVLLSQIEAGGTGLNIQAASVVILCEPQFKPSIEDQAIARAHRMGQNRVVTVYRLLAKESVDDALLTRLGMKARLFDRFARTSVVAEATDAAIDTGTANSDAALARDLISTERRRLSV
jgi:SNF2 family DNA or RNA helicase